MSNSKDASANTQSSKRTTHKPDGPEGKLVCDAYGIPVPKEGRIRRRSREIATGMGFPW